MRVVITGRAGPCGASQRGVGVGLGVDDGDPGAYAGLLADEGPLRARAAYPGATWKRLTAAKATYDPDNLFRLNPNIPPEV